MCVCVCGVGVGVGVEWLEVLFRASNSFSFYLAGLASGIDLLMGLEKQCRVGNDLTTLKRVVLHAIQLCKKSGDYEKLIDTLNFIVKRRSQKNAAITEIVKEAIKYIDEAPDEDVKIKLVVCLRDITDGRIYVEVRNFFVRLRVERSETTRGRERSDRPAKQARERA